MATFRAEVVGSLLRPQWLKDARIELQEGRITPAEFKGIEDRAVDEALAIQYEAGVDVVTDGEQRRSIFFATLTDFVEGISPVSEPLEIHHHWRKGNERAPAPIELPAVTGKLRRKRSLAAEEFTYLRAKAIKPVKMTIPSPLMIGSLFSPKYSRGAYPDPFKLMEDAARIVREDIEELVSLGCQYIQVDAPELATLVDPDVRSNVYEANGISPDRLLTEGVELINATVAGLSGVKLGIHVCRGNNAGSYLATGGYEYIAKKVFAAARNFDTFSLEYDDRRSGGFEPLADMPRDKTVILGLVSTKKGELEDPEELKRRVDEAAKFFPRNQLALSTQCGFASVMAGNPITPEQQREKLKLVAETAHRIWS
ncbi:cobalamin-independent methionine synthase II family protein [Methylacidimicrobium tartarophylax]|uniref:5-methyltetrahydropteroyltriglutamate--homocysteine methyltransferase n=1 Tax=Methylacidimicrobium tartarophylax TaxID=1041768 RepID=A0A5E6MEG1_9BACT|nr:cobalamin-independent methionine synthase II family protein [Methylacidimicrobium tartarophylax]VVM07364.1 5-methyltetrahydropteroyltriglutamate--homocysteine methyltransferase [Methylacidimicrobium tartarophylax]